MKIEVLYVPNCPNHALALDRLREILSVESFQKQVSEILMKRCSDGTFAEVSRLSDDSYKRTGR
jgi:hypothetical protein